MAGCHVLNLEMREILRSAFFAVPAGQLAVALLHLL